MKRNNHRPVSMNLQVKSILWRDHNECVIQYLLSHGNEMLRSFDFRFERPGPGSHRFRLLNTKWQDLQSLLLWPFTSCGLSYLKVRMNNNLRKVLAILWVTFGKLNTTRFHNKTVDRYRQLKYAVAMWPVTGQGH